jgi:uncharacterized protein (TIGR01777 family)
MKAVLAGGSGFLGQIVARDLRSRGWEVVILTRRPRPRGDGIREAGWDGRTSGLWAAELEGAAALLNFTGRSINCVHTGENRRQILESRLDSIGALAAAVRDCRQPPTVWVQCSATGYYGSRGPGECGEDTPPGTGFLADVCRQIEERFAAVAPAGLRKVVLRIGVVLGRRGGAWPPLARATRWFLGGAAGNGRQGFPWIHADDAAGVFAAVVTHDDWHGAYNACAPQAVSNAEFMHALRWSLGRPWCPSAPAPVVRLAARFILRTEPGLVLEGRSCAPRRLLAAGYQFRFPRLDPALADLAGRRG